MCEGSGGDRTIQFDRVEAVTGRRIPVELRICIATRGENKFTALTLHSLYMYVCYFIFTIMFIVAAPLPS